MTFRVVTLVLLSSLALGQTLQQQLDSGRRFVASQPGTISLSAPLIITTSGQTVDFSASTLVCNFDADCINVGNPANYNSVSNVTLLNPHGAPTIPGGTHSFITVYGQKTRIVNVTSATTPRGQPWGTWGHLVTVVGDQAFLLDGLDSTSGGFNVTCNAKFCGSWVYAPGPFSGCAPWCTGTIKQDNAALGWLTHMQLSAQCQGNGVDWQSGNTLVIRDSVIQGYAQFGVRAGVKRGGYGGTELDNVYMETGCAAHNPLGNVGSAGLIAQGGAVTIHSDRQPHGDTPRFAQTGSNYWLYFVTMNRKHGPYKALYQMADGSWSLDSVPMFLGDAMTDGKTPIKGQFPAVPGAVVYRVLRTQMQYAKNGNGSSPLPVATPPQGTGNWLVATIQASSCATLCQFTDSMATPQSYTTENPTQPNRDATYYPDFQFWPGDLVLTYGAHILANDPVGAGNRYTIVNPWRPGN